MVMLYHGTVTQFERPDLVRSRRGMDFGAGFYATPNREAAIRWASKIAYMHRGATPVVLAFEFDEAKAIHDGLVKDFPVMNREWVNFVLANRLADSQAADHNLDARYEIVHGYVADDRLMQIIDDYRRGDLSIDEVESRLSKAPFRAFQYSFHTERAIDCLSLKEALT